MKNLAAALLGGAMMLAAPAFAVEYDMHHSAMNHSGVMERHESHASFRQRASYHYDRRHSYRRTWRNDRDEHRATEDLNRQYRGVER